ncbi:PREDICTED: E3 ubiquitin-protein ligase TRIM39-like, partial [Apaloderma vittatum]|uniref:E3 ubiquitin-protein ligase TRIM39-like n=1 Tax=Apaloderma vittatum TaxID=57397 RepID=UPI000521CBD8
GLRVYPAPSPEEEEDGEVLAGVSAENRLVFFLCVLASRGFTAGRHYWELEVGDGDSWAAGVAVESVGRKESLSMTMGKIWALRLHRDRPDTGGPTGPSVPVPLALEEKPRRIRVHLDYEAGRVTFYNAESMVRILQFEDAFTEKVFPYFWLWSQETCIRLCA